MPVPSHRRRSYSLFVTIFGIFMLLSALIAASVTATNYLQLRASAVVAAEESFRASIERIDEKKESLFGVLILVADVFSDAPAVTRETPLLRMDGLLPNFLRAMTLHPHVFEIYAGYENGDFYQIFSLAEDDLDITLALGGPPESRYAVHEIALQSNGERRETWRFFDREQVEISSFDTGTAEYDPRIRDWYKQARTANQNVIRTPPYVFAISPEVGLSFAKSFDGPVGGVLATDITLDRLSAFLLSIRPNPQHRVLVFDEQMRLLAHPDPDKILTRTGAADDLTLAPAKVTDLRDPLIKQTLSFFTESGPFTLREFELAGETYLASIERFVEAGSTDYVLYAAPRSEFEGRIAEAANRGVLAGLVVIFLSLPIIFVLARSISRPLVDLSGEANLIQNFQLDEPIKMQSSVKEVNTLIGAMSNMKGTMQAISKYVPKALVKDILSSDRPVEVGGEKRHVSVLFTDVENFTPISDSMTPEDLMHSMSEYFEDLVTLIIEQEGTVDKFVGDAIFSYWNAPLPVERYEYMACYAAFRCRQASTQLGEKWSKMGRLGWYTRFGVHAGDAVVGNVGSSDRIDFTAIGDTINIGSRLEGLNKYYGTSILASGQIAHACSDDFLFRFVDHSLPKGAGSPLEIYEPLGMYNGPDEFRVTKEQVAFLADWDEALDVYNRKDWVHALDAMESFIEKHPDDGVARVYLDRIVEFLLEPPAPDWDGVMRFTKK